MNTYSLNSQFQDVGDNDRPRNRPRGVGRCGAAYYVGAAHVNDPATDQEHNRPRQSPTSPGGQYRAPQGISTRDGITDAELREDHRRRLAEFERELAQFDIDSAGNHEPRPVPF